MDRSLYLNPFRVNEIPEWTCPTCNKGLIHTQNSTFMKDERASTKKFHQHPAFEIDWLQFVYSTIFTCQNTSCGEVISSTGTGYIFEDHIESEFDGSYHSEYIEYFIPTFFQPHLNFFNIPLDAPNNVIEPIQMSFSLFFCSPSSALNNVRIALENLLDYLEVARLNSEGRRLPLHHRISQVKVYKELIEPFLAIKYLGNTGSHEYKDILKDDVLDVYEVLEFSLEKIFSTKEEEIQTLVKNINDAKGPQPRKSLNKK